jgi:hypothetical protein
MRLLMKARGGPVHTIDTAYTVSDRPLSSG